MDTIKKYQKYVLANTIIFGIAACSFSINGNEIIYLPHEYPIVSLIFAGIAIASAILLSKSGSKKYIIGLTIFVLLLPFTFVGFNGIKWLYISFLPAFALGFFMIGIVNLNRLRLHKIQ